MIPLSEGCSEKIGSASNPSSNREKDDEVVELEPPLPEMMQDFHDSNILPFPRREKKAKTRFSWLQYFTIPTKREEG